MGPDFPIPDVLSSLPAAHAQISIRLPSWSFRLLARYPRLNRLWLPRRSYTDSPWALRIYNTMTQRKGNLSPPATP